VFDGGKSKSKDGEKKTKDDDGRNERTVIMKNLDFNVKEVNI
jgi:hypothetical protein